MNKYSVIEGISVTREHIEEAIKLDRMVYEEEYYVTLPQCLEWNKKNRRIYTMIRDDDTGHIVAYVNISPITDEYYDKIRSGEFIDTSLPPEAIVDYVLPDTYNVYFSSIVVHPDYQNSQVFLLLFNAIAEKFTKLAEEEILIRRMIADAVSEKGEKFCEMFGMKKQKNSDHDSEIYEVRMLPPAFRVSSRATRDLFRVYKRIADELGFEDDESKEEPVPAERAPAFAPGKAAPLTEAGVFISYAGSEEETAAAICEYLERRGVSCWIAPRNVVPGGNYAPQIVAAIRSASALLLVASKEADVSPHVSNEISIAFDNKKPIIPFRIEDFSFSDENLYFLGRKNWIDAYSDMQAGLEKLLRALRRYLPAPKPEKDPPTPVKPDPKKDAPDPETPAPANELLSKDELVRLILKKAGNYSTRQISRFENEGRFEALCLLANRFLAQVFSVRRYNKPLAVQQPIDYLAEELLSDDDAEVIKVSGMPGCGKTVLMQAAFYKTIKKYAAGEIPYLPFYLALGDFERREYRGNDSADKLRAAIEDELKEYLCYIAAHPEAIPVLFIDEVREHVIGKINLENILLEILKGCHIYKRVVAVDVGLIKDRTKNKRIVPLISERISAKFEASPIDMHDRKKAHAFLSNVAQYFDCEVDERELFDLLKKLKYQEIDVFLARRFSEEIFFGQSTISSRRDVYEKWALSEMHGDDDQLREAARLAYAYLFRSDYPRAEAFSHPHWRLVHLHQSFFNMLIAYHLIGQLETCDEADLSDSRIFDVMLTSASYTFLRSYFQDNYLLQEKLLSLIKRRLPEVPYANRICAVSWLTALTSKSLIAEAASFLRPIYEENKQTAKKSDNTTQQNYDLQMYYRSVCLSLIKFGSTEILDDYLCLLITNDSANAINRGASVEYFEEPYEMHANGNCYLDTDVRRGGVTIKALLWKVGRLLSAGVGRYPEFDLMTLCMLLQRRIQSNESKQVHDLNEWVSETRADIRKYQMRPQHIRSEKIEYYFSSIQDDFSDYLENSDGFDISQKLYNTLRKMRNIKRRQWKENGIDDPESVSEHSYSVWMMAMLFLPEDLGYDGYSKREILDMLLIHDMAEAKLGDQVLGLNEPKKDLRIQNEIMRKLMVKGTYPNVASLTYYYNIWTGYYNGVNINSKIARDFNLIQSVYTFCEYCSQYPDHFSAAERARWMDEKNKLETEIGFAVYEKLVENNSDFETLFGEQPQT